METDATRLSVAFGVSTNWYTLRPATRASVPTDTVVLGSSSLRKRSASCAGVERSVGSCDSSAANFDSAVAARSAGTLKCVAALLLESYSHTSLPFCTTSRSAMRSLICTRDWLSPPAYTRNSWEPLSKSSAVLSAPMVDAPGTEAAAPSGMDSVIDFCMDSVMPALRSSVGRPRSDDWETVPEKVDTVLSCTRRRTCSGVLSGRSTAAPAWNGPAMTAATTTAGTTTAGSHLRELRDMINALVHSDSYSDRTPRACAPVARSAYFQVPEGDQTGSLWPGASSVIPMN